MDPDILINGYIFFNDNDNMDIVMEFLARYVCKIYGDRFLKKRLQAEQGTSFVNMITSSDIAYVISLIKNSQHIWVKVKLECIKGELNDDGREQSKKKREERPLFTSGEGKKRTFGDTV